MPVVKADAYRHGAIAVSRVLEAEGAGWLAVSNVEEGVALRQAGMRGAHSGDGGFSGRRPRGARTVSTHAGDSFARRSRRGAGSLSSENRQRHGAAGDARRAGGNRARRHRRAGTDRRADDALRVVGKLRRARRRRSRSSASIGWSPRFARTAWRPDTSTFRAPFRSPTVAWRLGGTWCGRGMRSMDMFLRRAARLRARSRSGRRSPGKRRCYPSRTLKPERPSDTAGCTGH